MNNISLVVLALLVVSGIYIVATNLPIPSIGDFGVEPGKTAPDFALKTIEGNTVKLSDYRGKGVLINFWASWCPPCASEFPFLVRERNKHIGKMEVLAINLQENTADARGFVQRFNASFPILLDPEASVKKLYKVSTQPVSVFIDKNGKIIERRNGELLESEIIDKFALLAGESQGYANSEVQGDQVQVTNGVKHLIPLGQVVEGGPGKDGIPSIDQPKFLRNPEVDFLTDNEQLLALELNGVAKAYPLQLLVWHEIVNDEINGEPVVVTFCPLCGSGIAFIRKLDNTPVEFGVSGKLYNSDLLMYDRKTDTLWSQISGQAVVGERTGEKLEKIPVNTITWKTWKEKYPNGTVLSRDTGFNRQYGIYPYGDYEASDELYFPITNRDSRLGVKETIYGLEVNGSFKAYPLPVLREKNFVNDVVAGQSVAISYNDGIVAVNVSGKATLLTRTFWFAWAAFHPSTEIYVEAEK